ncbi:MAG: hypothetical protein FWF12_12005 [Betaproteobacteria bacterium]|nr:hypothetical protein [Betaproteobacteria bacterium]
MCDFLLMLFTLLVAKRLILLAYYHAESLQSYQAIQFERNGGDWVVWFNRVNHAAGSKVEQMELVARSVQFLSKCDEEQFFGWLDKLPCVTGYYGQGTDLLIGVQGDQLDDISLRELLGLFHRYDIDAPQLAAFETDANRVWFRDSRAYWHASVFG